MWQFMRLARLTRAERARASDSADHRYNLGYFALVPVGLAVGFQLGHSLLSKSHPGVLWMILGSAGIASYFGSLLWGRLVPAQVSLYLGLIGWTVLLWLFWHNHS